MTILSGNYSAGVPYGRSQGILPGFDFCWLEGTAAISATPATSWAIETVLNQPMLLAATAANPIWLIASYFDLPVAFQGTTGDRLKVGATRADVSSYIANSLPVDAGGFLQIQDNITSVQEPFVFTKLTAATTLQLWLHTGNGAPTGTGLIPSPPSPTVLINPAPIPPPTTRIPVRVEYLMRSTAPDATDISPEQSRKDLGLPLY